MENEDTGVNFQIFSDIITKYGSDVSWSAATTTASNMDGDLITTFATAVTKRVYIVRKNTAWTLDKAGHIEGGNALMLAKPSHTVHKYDKIVWQGNTYTVKDVLDRDQIGSNVAYKACNLFLVDA